jgi:hypothetical protein
MQSTLGKIRSIRRLTVLFIVILALSGVTAFPLRAGMHMLRAHHQIFPGFLQDWLLRVSNALDHTPELMFYGTDWLAFAHLVIALFFVPVYRDPVRYEANLNVGMIACAGVLPLAFVCGPIRGIPFFHQLIDCSFGVLGFVLLYLIYFETQKLKRHEDVR